MIYIFGLLTLDFILYLFCIKDMIRINMKFSPFTTSFPGSGFYYFYKFKIRKTPKDARTLIYNLPFEMHPQPDGSVILHVDRGFDDSIFHIGDIIVDKENKEWEIINSDWSYDVTTLLLKPYV